MIARLMWLEGEEGSKLDTEEGLSCCCMLLFTFVAGCGEVSNAFHNCQELSKCYVL